MPQPSWDITWSVSDCEELVGITYQNFGDVFFRKSSFFFAAIVGMTVNNNYRAKSILFSKLMDNVLAIKLDVILLFCRHANYLYAFPIHLMPNLGFSLQYDYKLINDR